VKQAVRRVRALAVYRVVLGGACASLLALACGGGSEPSALDDRAPIEPDRDRADEPAVDDGPVNEGPLDANPSPRPDPVAVEQPTPEPAPPVAEPETPRTCDTTVGFDALYSDVANDLNAEGDDGVFLRYVSLGNRLNQGVCPEQLDTDRFGLIKAVNSLSTQVGMAVPEAIDADATLYRIDLRDLGWDRTVVVDGVEFLDKWEALIAASPYAIQFEGDDAEDAQIAAATRVPVLFVDALIDAAMVDNLYYAMIEVGESEDELLAQLGIVEDDIELRVGTGRSRLSQQDALAERIPLVGFQGYYWSRYDLAQDTGGQSVFADPLEFQADSIAAVFSLPNGLNGYALFDGAGLRVTDSDVIVDASQRDGRVRNGVSCSQCHAGGLLPMIDEVRAYAAANRRDFDADTLGEIEDTFLTQPEIDDVIRGDAELYSQALARAGLETSGADPIAAAYIRFDREVTLAVAAGELGVTAAELDAELSFLAGRVDGSLATLRNSSLRREQFDALYLPALCVMQAVGDNRPAAEVCAAVGQ